MQITAKMVAELRDRSGAGIMKCKQALVACDGDMEKAMDELRKSGLASAGKRADRATSQGIVLPLISADKRHVGFVEVNCETDFVAKTDIFIECANKLAQLVLDHPEVKSVADLEKLTVDGVSVDEYRKSIIAKCGENCTISRAEHLDVPEGTNGLFDKYVHNKVTGSEGGQLGVLVQIKAADASVNEEATKVAHQVALHIAMNAPIAICESEVSQEEKDREYSIGYEKAKVEAVAKAVNKALEKAGINPAHVDSEEHMKSNCEKGWITEEKVAEAREIKTKVGAETLANLKEQMLQNIAKGRLAKYLKEGCLLDQIFLMDDTKTKTVANYVAESAKAINTNLEITAFRRWKCGEAGKAEEKAAE